MKKFRLSLPLTFITMLSIGTLMCETVFAAGSWSGGARSSGSWSGGARSSGGMAGGAGFSGGGRAGGPGFNGGWRGGGGRMGHPGYRGGRYAGSGWNRGGNVGIFLGAPIGFGGFYPYSYYGAGYYGGPYYQPAPYYYPLVQPAPVTYIERSDESQVDTQTASNDSSQDVQNSWWYYCVDAKAYYPYVAQCPAGWLQVAPQPESRSADQPVSDNSSAR